MGFSKQFPRVYNKNSSFYLQIDRATTYEYIAPEIEPQLAFVKGRRVCWSVLPIKVQLAFIRILVRHNLNSGAAFRSLNRLAEFDVIRYRNSYIYKRRVRIRAFPGKPVKYNYLVNNEGFNTLREAKKWVDAQLAIVPV